MSHRIHLAELTAAIDAAGTTMVLRVTDADTYATGPGETPPNTPYLPRLKSAAQMRRDVVAGRRTAGATQVGVGVLELVNVDGSLDDWLDYGFDGRECVLRVGEAGGAYPGDFMVVMRGTMEQPTATLATLTIRLRDRLAEFDRPLLTTRYAGSNVLPAGAEGVEDIAGRVKPRVYGLALNVSPVLINTSRLLYQVSDGAVSVVADVRDRGVVLTAGAVYADQADMEANAPAAGQYRVWLGGGMFRLGSTPTGLVTCKAAVGATPADRRPAGLMQQVALDMGIASGDIDAGDAAALDAAAAYDCGVWVSDERPALAVLDELARSAGAWYGFDRLGVLRMQQLRLPNRNIAANSNRLDLWGQQALQSIGTNPAPPPAGGDQPYEVVVNLVGGSIYAAFAPSDSATFSVYLRASANDTASVGVYSDGGWGADGDGAIRLLEGPGAVTQNTGALAEVTGLSPGEWTRLAVGRRGLTTTAYAYVCPGAGSAQAGDSVLVSSPQIEDGLTPTPFRSTAQGLGADRGPAVVLSDDQVVRFDRRVAEDDARLPVWRVDVGYGRNHTPMGEAEFAGAVSQADRALLREANLRAVVENASVKVKNLLAEEIERDTGLIEQAHAAALANHLLALHSVRRDVFDVRVRVTPADLARLDLGVAVVVARGRFGAARGLYRVLGIREDHATGGADLVVWG